MISLKIDSDGYTSSHLFANEKDAYQEICQAIVERIGQVNIDNESARLDAICIIKLAMIGSYEDAVDLYEAAYLTEDVLVYYDWVDTFNKPSIIDDKMMQDALTRHETTYAVVNGIAPEKTIVKEEYGSTCKSCNEYNEHAIKSNDFVCFGCKL